MSAESLKEKMKEFTEGRLGSVKVTGADLSGGGADEKPHTPTKGTVEADVPDAAKTDVFTEADATSDLHQGMTPSFLQEKIDISEEDREAFLRAIVSGERYERDFSLFGGKLTGVFRCRKVEESDGIIAWLSHCINAKKLDARIEYLSLMRNATLAAQVKSLRGLVSEDFPELEAPYGPMRKKAAGDDGQEDEIATPGWVEQANAWGRKPEALTTAIHNELQRFERRYWAMIADAGNQNFWNPAASI